MSANQRKIIHFVLYLLLALTVVCIIYHITSVYKFNSTKHSVKGLAEDEPVYVDIHFREGDTSSWIKRNMGLYGKIYDASLANNADNEISEWTLRINITGDCYINQFWNGEAEIHQHVSEKKEKIQTLNLAHYDENAITLDYVINESDLMIPLEAGDYIIYHPSVSLGENPVEANHETVVGFILYFKEDIDLTDYTLDYYMKRGLTQGPLFPVICAMSVLFLLIFGSYLTSNYAYRKAQKEMDLRRSGIACMAELYAAIYIIDLDENTLTPVGMTEEADRKRPKDMTAGDQLKNLADKEIDPEYRNLVRIFVDLTTVNDRMEKRNSLAVECVGIGYGWCRMRFIAMERDSEQHLKKVLFTIQQINEEKVELDAIREQTEKEKFENQERKAYLDGIYREAQTPVRSILKNDNLILSCTEDETVRHYASEIKKTAETFLVLVDNTLDVSYLASGKMELTPFVYDLNKIVSDAQKTVQVSLEGKDIELNAEIAKSVPDKLYGDGPKLRRIITSLLSRTIADLDSGIIKLRIFGKTTDQENVHLLISVQGTGAHIDDTEAGIGMRLVEGLITLMGSTLKTADLGMGRDYYFELDQKIPVQAEMEEESSKEEES